MKGRKGFQKGENHPFYGKKRSEKDKKRCE